MYNSHNFVYYPKRSTKELFTQLINQCNGMGVKILDESPSFEKYDLIVDAIFGFSFEGEIREPFGGLIKKLKAISDSNSEL